MANQHSKDSLASFQDKLAAVDTSWQVNFNLREVVRESFYLIQNARKYKVGWNKIAELLKESSSTEISVSPESIRQYYFEFAKNPDLLPKKKRKPSPNKKKSKDSTPDSTSTHSSSKMGLTNPEASDSDQPIAPPVEPELEQSASQASESGLTPETSHSGDPIITPSAPSKPVRPAKDDVRSQFNLSRRGK